MARLSGITNNLNAFLDTVAFSEGTSVIPNSDDGYKVIVGSTPDKPILFDDYSTHPNQSEFLSKQKIYSTAAGRYQVLYRYYEVYKNQLDLPDFSPVCQDKIAIQMIHECHALPSINAGNINNAIMLCKSRWASLPGSSYGQTEQTFSALRGAYIASGGITSTMPDA